MGTESGVLLALASPDAAWQVRSQSEPGPVQPGTLPFIGRKRGLLFRDAKTGWMWGDDDNGNPWLYRTDDGGATFAPVPIVLPSQTWVVFPPSAMRLAADGRTGTLLAWSSLPSPGGGSLLVTRDGGETFTPEDVPGDARPASVSAARHQRVQVETADGALWGSADGGASFARLATGLPPARWLEQGDHGEGWLASCQGAAPHIECLLYESRDGGLTFNVVHPDVPFAP
jgi:photosystem II stability/assembly factor-like uncharacterized protein